MWKENELWSIWKTTGGVEMWPLVAVLLCWLHLTLLSCSCDTKFMSCPIHLTSKGNFYKHMLATVMSKKPSLLHHRSSPFLMWSCHWKGGLSKKSSLGDASAHPWECWCCSGAITPSRGRWKFPKQRRPTLQTLFWDTGKLVCLCKKTALVLHFMKQPFKTIISFHVTALR